MLMLPNDLIIFSFLQTLARPVTRAELQIFTQLPRTTIYDALQRLRDRHGVVKEGWRDNGKVRGRPYTTWSVKNNE